jgi:hypothetical protein
MLRQVIEHGATVSIKVSDRCLGGVRDSPGSAGIIELQYRSGTFDAMVYLRCGDYESVSR